MGLDSDNTPLVSVVIIFFNAEPYLDEAIRSVLAQTHEHWELLLCDDGSTDGSTATAKRYVAQYSQKMRYLQHEGHVNRGAAATRNMGLRAARGRYISWLDADDVWTRQKLQRQVASFAEHPQAAMVYGPARFWFSWRGRPEDQRRDFNQELAVLPETLVPPPLLVGAFLQNDMYTPTGVMVRRDALLEVGGYEDTFRADYEDMIAHVKVCQRWPVYVSGEWSYLYRQHEKQNTARSNREGRDARWRQAFLAWVSDYLEHNGQGHSELWQLVEHLREPYRRGVRLHIAAQLHALMRGIRRVAETGKEALKRILPPSMRTWLRRRRAKPLDLGALRRLDPIGRETGWGRGLPVDQYYIRQFLTAHSQSIRGRVLEIGDGRYAPEFAASQIRQYDTLRSPCGARDSTLVGDLESGEGIPQDAFDCILLIHVLQDFTDVQAVLRTCRRALREGGVLLATLPGISRLCQPEMPDWRDLWRFTAVSARRLFCQAFPGNGASNGDGANNDQCVDSAVELSAYGNVLTAIASLHGLAADELRGSELDYRDGRYDVVLAVHARKLPLHAVAPDAPPVASADAAATMA